MSVVSQPQPVPSPEQPSCQVAVLTPPGRGAIASVVAFGPSATTIVERLFVASNARPLSDFPCQRIVFGHWMPQRNAEANDKQPPLLGEELIAVRRDLHTVEVHCHGGSAAVACIVKSLVAQGAACVTAHQWLATRHADPLVLDAHVAIAQARTHRTASILLDQVHGCLSSAIAETLHYVAKREYDAAKNVLRELLARLPVGYHLTQPWRVAVVGPVNVGKSSLINAILGYQRSLVAERPGTTRDVLTDVTAIDGWPVEFADTAGWRHATSSVEREGIRRAREQIAIADLVLLVTDLTQPWTRELQDWIDHIDQSCMLVHNKSDCVATRPSDRPPGLCTSALESTGIAELLSSIAQQLIPVPPPAQAPVPFLAYHGKLLADALHALQEKQFENAAEQLEDLLSHRGERKRGQAPSP